MLASGNCSGCGACVLAGAASRMELDGRGDLRPVVPPGGQLSPSRHSPRLEDYCPAISVRRPATPSGGVLDVDFGPALGVWSAHAADPEMRRAGSSGGALTALSSHLIEAGSEGVVMVRGEAGSTRTQPFVAGSIEDAVEGASSRYAPVSTLAALSGVSTLEGRVVVGRPCEATALRALVGEGLQAPTILSFFCAGVPSQHATTALVQRLGCDPQDVEFVRYRGQGWPGAFSVTDSAGRTFETSYEASWGEVLGRDLQARCKICVDGVGESADVVAADLWEADSRGYPVFEEAPGVSLLIARTQRGSMLVADAARAGYLEITPTDLESSRVVQQMQVGRRRFLLGRLVGRRAAGQVNPSYKGFGLWRTALRSPLGNLRQARGSYRRARSSSLAETNGPGFNSDPP